MLVNEQHIYFIMHGVTIKIKYMKCVNFAWLPLEVAVSIFNVSSSVKIIFCWQGIRGYISVVATLKFDFC